jgi:hypothetical protein
MRPLTGESIRMSSLAGPNFLMTPPATRRLS